MSFLLPTKPDIRELVCLPDLANWMELPTFGDISRKIRRGEIKVAHGISFITFQCIKANGSVVLLRVGPRGGMRVIHDFGKA